MAERSDKRLYVEVNYMFDLLVNDEDVAIKQTLVN
jgi:hypothetical protein